LSPVNVDHSLDDLFNAIFGNQDKA